MLLAALALSVTLSHASVIAPITPPTPPPIVAFPEEPPPTIDAASWAVHDADADLEIGSRNGDDRRAMASVTKIMTVLLAAEQLEDWDVPAPISAAAQGTPIGYTGQPRVLVGDTWTVRELILNVMVQSGNDAAVALAEAVAGSESAFVDAMNARATDLGMTNTAYRNPNGLDADGHFSSARDLVKVAMAALQHERIVDVTSTVRLTFDPGQRPEITVQNTNRLLGVFPYLFGLKTGDTARASKVLVAYVDTGSRSWIVVVMGSGDHMLATQRLAGWAMSTGGVRDHFYAHAMGTSAEELLGETTRARAGAVAPLDTGQWLLPAFGSTPAERAILDALDQAIDGIEGNG